MASRFFATGSSTESESESSDDEVQVQAKPTSQAARLFFSDDEDETKRVVRSAKSKRHEELSGMIKKIRNLKKFKDLSGIQSAFEDMTKLYQKSKAVLDENGTIPRFYTRCLVELEDFVNVCWGDKKNLSKIHSKSLATLRQRLRKYNKEYEKELNAYRESPDVDKSDEEEEEEQEDEMSGDDDDGPIMAADFLKKEKELAPVKPAAGSGDEESDDSYWDTDSDEDSSSSDSDVGYGQLTAAHFLKKTTDKDSKQASQRRERKKEKEKEKKPRGGEEDDGEGEWEEVKGGAPAVLEKPKMFGKDVEITHVVVMKKLNEIISARGKRGTDRSEQIELLKELRTIGASKNLGPAIDLKILFNIIAAIFDYNPNVASCMRSEMWEKCMKHIREALAILKETDIIVSDNILEDAESLEEAPFKIHGCILTIVERMDEEYTKILQATDAHSTEYVERLKDEIEVTDIIVNLQERLESIGHTADICRCYLKHIMHIYYKYDYDNLKKLQQNRKKQDSKEEGPEEKKDDVLIISTVGKEKADGQKEKRDETTGELMERMCKFIYSKDTTDIIRTRAMLCHIYHHALHNRWYKARDLMMMSHLQQTIQYSDIPTQILYNRTLAQLGLCAFRHGNIKDAHNALLDLQSGGRAKELLAQGILIQRQQERDPQQEKIDKSRHMPFHMHINLELLECVYLASAMLLEIPYMASHHFDIRRRMISKSFHHQLRLSERQTLVGPPESMREHVVAASRAMRYGDWRGCRDFLINDKMNLKVWNLFHNADSVRSLITRKIQEESLRTYLFTYGSVYDSISLITLSEMFELEKENVHSIISKMIINEELLASWDEPAATIVMHRCEPTKLQNLALRLADKVNNLVENNERLLDFRQGDSRNYKSNNDRQQNQNKDREGRGNQYRDRKRDQGGYRNRRRQRNY